MRILLLTIFFIVSYQSAQADTSLVGAGDSSTAFHTNLFSTSACYSTGGLGGYSRSCGMNPLLYGTWEYWKLEEPLKPNTEVPEPGSMALLAAGSLLAWRKRKQA